MPVPDPTIYDGLDFIEESPKPRDWLQVVDDDTRAALRLQPPTEATPLLDFGCNTGEAVRAFRSAGIPSEGCDIDSRAVEWGRSQGIPLFVADLEQGPLEKQYSGVLMNHTLEHLVRPELILRNLARSLTPGGIVHVRVPNFGGLIPRIMGEDWGFLVPYQHVWQFTPKTLVGLARSANLRLITMTARQHLEYQTAGLKGTAKQVIFKLAIALNASDEIRATFQVQ